MFKVGDLVRVKSKDAIGSGEVTRPCGYIYGLPLQWIPSMDKYAGRVGTVSNVTRWREFCEVSVKFDGDYWKYRDSFLEPAAAFKFKAGDQVRLADHVVQRGDRTRDLVVDRLELSQSFDGQGRSLVVTCVPHGEPAEGFREFRFAKDLDFISRPCDCVDTPTSPESQPAECVCVDHERKETFSLAMTLNYDDSDVIAYSSRQVVDGMSDIGEVIAAGIKATTLSRSSLILARAIVESCEPSMKCPNAKAVNDASDELRLQAMKVIDAWDAYDRHVSDNER